MTFQSFHIGNRSTNLLLFFLLIAILLLTNISIFSFPQQAHPLSTKASSSSFIASVDTMKESMDTSENQLTPSQIAADVTLCAALNVNYITVDVYYDYPSYMQEWVNAIRKTGKHIWFRSHFNAWEGDNGITATMTPAIYLQNLKAFILANPTIYQSGDIFDSNPEAENSPYWTKTYGTNWSWQNAPNAGTDAFNKFILDLTATADNALKQDGISNVTTNIRSMNAWFWENPTGLYPITVASLGIISLDTYADNNTTDPVTAEGERVSELNTIWNIRHIPIVIAEMGYSNTSLPNDATQNAIITEELKAINNLSFVVGINYWVGAGSSLNDGTRLFNGSKGNWTLRPAANTLASFYGSKFTNLSTPLVPTIFNLTPTTAVTTNITNTPLQTNKSLPTAFMINPSAVNSTPVPTHMPSGKGGLVMQSPISPNSETKQTSVAVNPSVFTSVIQGKNLNALSTTPPQQQIKTRLVVTPNHLPAKKLAVSYLDLGIATSSILAIFFSFLFIKKQRQSNK